MAALLRLDTHWDGGRFREDLFFRLNVVPIASPPLRDRREDIPALVEHFVEAFCNENNCKRRRMAPGAMIRLQARTWRGNVRELRNFVERLLIMSEGETVQEEHVQAMDQGATGAAGIESAPGGAEASPAQAAWAAAPSLPIPGRTAAGPGAGPDPASFATLQEYREEAEKVFILRKLREFRWNISRMAKAIDTPRSNLYKKLEQYGITRDQVQE